MRKIYIIFKILTMLITLFLFKESNAQVTSMSYYNTIVYSNYCTSMDVSYINLDWESFQINVNHWDVMRSTDNVNWDELTSSISGSCTGNCHHSFQDTGPFTPGATYYYHVKAIYYILGIKNTKEWNFGSFTIYTPQSVLSRDWQYMTSPEYVDITSTSSNSDDYVWHEESNIIQGVHLNLVPGEQRFVVLEQNNHIINFTIRNASSATANTNPFISHIDVNIDNQGYNTIFDASSNGGVKADVVWYGSSSTFNDVGGQHTLQVKWIDATNGGIYTRIFDVYIIPASQHLYKDNYCNTLRLWAGNDPGNEVPMMLSEGFDPYNMKQIQFYYAASEELVTCMLTKGFNAYFLNYGNGGQDIRNNAAVFASAVKYISSINGNQKIVASGVSMGGVIARYAFAKAEGQGNPLPASKFVTFDSPHQGAVLSQPLQDFRKRSIDDNGGNSFQAYAVSNIAAEELLTYNSYDPSGNMHTAFYNELNNLNGDGYPHQTVNIGISFSNPHPNPNSGTWLSIACQSNCTYVNLQLPKNFDLQPNEEQPGSYLPTFLTDMGPVTELIPILPPDVDWMLNFIVPTAALFVGGLPLMVPAFKPLYPTITMTRLSHPCYVPYVSALDEPYVGGTSKFVSAGLPGSKTIEPVVTSWHDIVPSEPLFINTILNAMLTDNVYLQDKDITDTRTYIANKTITAGNNVNPNPSISTGDFVVESGANVTFKAGQSINIESGFDAKAGSNFYAYIAAPVTTCDGINENQMKIPNQNQPTEPVKEIQATNSQQLNLIIFPNPNNGNMTVSYEIPKSEMGVLEIYNSLGTTLFSYLLKEGNNTFTLLLYTFIKIQ